MKAGAQEELPKLLKAGEAARILQVHVGILNKWVRAGRLSDLWEGGKRRYDATEVLRLRDKRAALKGVRIDTVRKRLLSGLIIRPSGCVEWSGSQDNHGYGTLSVNARPAKVHRLMYEMFVGPIPERYDVDHLCRNTICAAPAHLDAVTHQVNIQRGYDGKPKKPKCLRGHDRTPENVGSNGGCRKCRHENESASRPTPIRPPLNEEQQPGTVPGTAA